jgi:hypothetical protein
MGTNYYAHTNVCKCCNRPEEKVHIGKSSYGWTFTFHAIKDLYDVEDIVSYKDWLKFLSKENVKIVDEYGKECSLDDFKKIVEAKRDCKLNHAKECAGSRYDHSFLDEDGNSFSEGEFS